MDPRDQTFMTIHNLTPDANILFASDSVFDILGYQPDEVRGKSCFDFFHPDEVPLARSVHSRGVLLDKAAVLHYARILSRDGRWVSCECCFTIVHDVLVACTSIYLRGEKSERRALEAPQIRRIFSSSPRDPRYHMLEHLSPKFKMPSVEREPRAALILNRFTRNLSIMFATNAVTSILGLRPDEIKDKAFYECIQENCLQDAIQCLESAKANESIAYLRFWFRDPRVGEHDDEEEDNDEGDEDEDRLSGDQPMSGSNSDSEGGGVPLDDDQMEIDDGQNMDIKGESVYSVDNDLAGSQAAFLPQVASLAYQTPLTSQSSGTGRSSRVDSRRRSPRPVRQRDPAPSFELEAVVSCTSDGLVVVLRKARPQIPAPQPPLLPASPFNFENGLFAAPWGLRPIEPFIPPELLYHFRPPLLPQYMPLRESVKAAGGPPLDQLMRSIRDVAVFAWALVGINGNLAAYGQGIPRGGAQPPDGLPVWDANAGPTAYRGPDNQAAHRWTLGEGKGSASAGLAFGRNHNYTSSDRTPQSYNQAHQPSPDNYAYANNSGGVRSHQTQPSSAWPQPMLSYGSTSAPRSGPEVAGRGYDGYDDYDTYESTSCQHQQAPPTTYAQTPSVLQPSHHPGHQQMALPPPSADFHGLPQEPWVEASASQSYTPSYAIPTTQAPSQDEPAKDFRYRWP